MNIQKVNNKKMIHRDECLNGNYNSVENETE